MANSELKTFVAQAEEAFVRTVQAFRSRAKKRERGRGEGRQRWDSKGGIWLQKN